MFSNHSQTSLTVARGQNGKDSNCDQIVHTTSENRYVIVVVVSYAHFSGVWGPGGGPGVLL